MANSFNIKCLGKEYFVTLDDKPVCPGIKDEPGVFDNIIPIYRSFVKMFGDEHVKMVCISDFVEDNVSSVQVEKDGQARE